MADHVERVINTPALLVRDPAESKFTRYRQPLSLSCVSDRWPVALVQSPPAQISALTPTNAPAAAGHRFSRARIIVSTTPAELLLTSGLPDFRPIRGTRCSRRRTRTACCFNPPKSRRLTCCPGPVVQGDVALRAVDLRAAGFAGGFPPRFPPTRRKRWRWLAPDTQQAELALVVNTVPTTATVNRHTAKIDLKYDGLPQFKPIEGTTMSYAVNAQLPVIRAGKIPTPWTRR